jgi:hypothetical protein
MVGSECRRLRDGIVFYTRDGLAFSSVESMVDGK